MVHSTKPIDDDTALNDISILKLPSDRVYSLNEFYVAEVKNIAIVTLKHLSNYRSLIAMYKITY